MRGFGSSSRYKPKQDHLAYAGVLLLSLYIVNTSMPSIWTSIPIQVWVIVILIAAVVLLVVGLYLAWRLYRLSRQTDPSDVE